MKTLNKILVLCLLLAGGAVASAEYLGLPWMYNLAAMGFGLVAITGGLRIMITGRARGAAVGMSQFYGENEGTERHTGARARMIGALLLIAGPVFIALSAIELSTPGGMDAFWDEFLRSPRAWGLVVGLAGVMITLMGIVRARAGTAAAAGTHSEAVEAELKGGGILAVVAGVALIVMAAVLILAPGLFHGTLDELFSTAARDSLRVTSAG